MNLSQIQIKDKIKFSEETQRYTVRARNDRYLICTKPMNAKKTVLYTIVDLLENIRGTEDLIFCMGFETNLGCQEALARLDSGESYISRRNFIPLKVDG